jgi:ribonuclease P protein component
VFESGRRLSGRYFTVILRGGTEDGPRLGLIVSKKVARAATRRNMIKRLVRESFRHANLAKREGFDLVVLARSGLAGAERGEIRRCLDRLLARAETHLSGGTPAP